MAVSAASTRRANLIQATRQASSRVPWGAGVGARKQEQGANAAATVGADPVESEADRAARIAQAARRRRRQETRERKARSDAIIAAALGGGGDSSSRRKKVSGVNSAAAYVDMLNAAAQGTPRRRGHGATPERPSWDTRVEQQRCRGYRSLESRGKNLDARPSARKVPKVYDRAALRLQLQEAARLEDAERNRKAKTAPPTIGRAVEGDGGPMPGGLATARLPSIRKGGPPPPVRKAQSAAAASGKRVQWKPTSSSPTRDRLPPKQAFQSPGASPSYNLNASEASASASPDSLPAMGSPQRLRQSNKYTSEALEHLRLADTRGRLSFDDWVQRKAARKQEEKRAAAKSRRKAMMKERQWIKEHSRAARKIFRQHRGRDISVRCIQRWWRRVWLRRVMSKLRLVKTMTTEDYIKRFGSSPDDTWLHFRQRLDMAEQARLTELEREERRRAELLEKAKKQRAKTRWSKTASKKAAIIDHDRTRIKAAVRATRQKTTYIWNESLEKKQEAKPPPPPEEKEDSGEDYESEEDEAVKAGLKIRRQKPQIATIIGGIKRKKSGKKKNGVTFMA